MPDISANDEIEDDDEQVGFDMTYDDGEAVELAIKTARLFLAHPSIKPNQIVALGKALYALEWMPEPILGLRCDFGITYSAGDKDYSEWKAIDFSINECSFNISVGGSVYDKTVGSDSYSRPGWSIEIGYQPDNSDCSLSELEYLIQDFLNLGGKITANDDCDDSVFEMEED